MLRKKCSIEETANRLESAITRISFWEEDSRHRETILDWNNSESSEEVYLLLSLPKGSVEFFKQLEIRCNKLIQQQGHDCKGCQKEKDCFIKPGEGTSLRDTIEDMLMLAFMHCDLHQQGLFNDPRVDEAIGDLNNKREVKRG